MCRIRCRDGQGRRRRITRCVRTAALVIRFYSRFCNGVIHNIRRTQSKRHNRCISIQLVRHTLAYDAVIRAGLSSQGRSGDFCCRSFSGNFERLEREIAHRNCRPVGGFSTWGNSHTSVCEQGPGFQNNQCIEKRFCPGRSFQRVLVHGHDSSRDYGTKYYSNVYEGR